MLTFYNLTVFFKLNNLSKFTLSYIQRCFTMTVDTENFLNLEFRSVAKILSCSELNVTSELKIFKAVQTWINYNSEKRNKFGKDLLLKVRIPLLSENELKYIEKSLMNKNKFLYTLTKEILKQKDFNGKSHIYFTRRHCTQYDFNILLCCGAESYRGNMVVTTDEEEDEDVVLIPGLKHFDITSTDINQLCLNNLNSYKAIGSMPKQLFYSKIVYCKGELYFFSGCNENNEIMSFVEKYSMFTNSSEIIPGVQLHRNHYCLCNFMDEIYFMGGVENQEDTETNSCVMFDTKAHKFENIAKMNDIRALAACTVFNGNIVVSGGVYDGDLKSVEVYDYSADQWKYMPSMVLRRSQHSLAAIRNKLFAVGGYQDKCEVFDATSNAFALMKNSRGFNFDGQDNSDKTVSVGNKLFVFFDHRDTALCYDLDMGDWIEEPCKLTKDFYYFCCAKVPVFNTFIK